MRFELGRYLIGVGRLTRRDGGRDRFVTSYRIRTCDAKAAKSARLYPMGSGGIRRRAKASPGVDTFAGIGVRYKRTRRKSMRLSPMVAHHTVSVYTVH